MLRQIGIYNKIPKELLPPPLKKGEVVTYRLLHSHTDPAMPGVQRYPAGVAIPSIDRVKLSDGNTYDIGLVTKVDNEGMVVDYKPVNIRNNNKNAGYFRLTGGILADEETYMLMELSNSNASNPNRDPSVPAKFKRIDDKADAKEQKRVRGLKLDAMNAAVGFDKATVKQFASAMGWDENEDEQILRDRIELFAEKDPEKFVKVWEDKDQSVKALIKRAEDAGHIQFDVVQSKWIWGDGGQETIATIAKVEGLDKVMGLSDYLNTSGKKGEAALRRIKKYFEEVPAEV